MRTSRVLPHEEGGKRDKSKNVCVGGYIISFVFNNIQAAISAFWLAENISINPKSVNSAISPVQKSEIEYKTVKLSAKQWN